MLFSFIIIIKFLVLSKQYNNRLHRRP